MKLELKNIYSVDYDLENFPLEYMDNFFMVVTISVGFAGQDGADDFNIYVYSTEWLNLNIDYPKLNRYSIIMKKFSLSQMIELINSILDDCSSETTHKPLFNLSKYFLWEFEGYFH